MTLDEEFERFVLEHPTGSYYAVWKAAWNAAQAQLKPSWSNAPSWAKYLAMDQYGRWSWYENKPFLAEEWWDHEIVKWDCANAINVHWKDTLEKRP